MKIDGVVFEGLDGQLRVPAVGLHQPSIHVLHGRVVTHDVSKGMPPSLRRPRWPCLGLTSDGDGVGKLVDVEEELERGGRRHFRLSRRRGEVLGGCGDASRRGRCCWGGRRSCGRSRGFRSGHGLSGRPNLAFQRPGAPQRNIKTLLARWCLAL